MKALKFKSDTWNHGILSCGLAFIFLFAMTYQGLHLQMAHQHEAVCQDHEKAAHFHQGNHQQEDCPYCQAYIPGQITALQIDFIHLHPVAKPGSQFLLPALAGILIEVNPSQRGPPLIV